MEDLQNSESSKTVEEQSNNTTSNKLLRNTLLNSSSPESLKTENAYEVSSNEILLNQTDFVENDRGTHARSRSFSQLLVGAMSPPGLLNSSSPTLVASPRFQAQFGMSHQQALASVTAQAVQAQAKMQIQSDHPPSSGVQPYSMLGDITPQQKKPLLGSGDMPITLFVYEQSNNDRDVQPNQLDLKSLQGDLKTPCDGYNWRKYGQKQVKGSERFRSYYRCSNPKCIVKKTIERCSDGFVHEIVYKGHHNHKRPEKIRSSKENFHPVGSSGETDKVNVAEGKSCIADSSLSSQEHGCVSDSSCQQLQNSTSVDRDTMITVSNEGNDDEPSPKRRNKDTITESQVFQFKIGREPKVVLQTESETGILGDGYRWRKYGQKLVKGNPNPRSYYKCTTMGCPVRKHVEKASDNTKAILVTYEGNHNHDLPSPKGCRDPSASAAAAMTNGGKLKSLSLFTYRLTSTRTEINRFDEKTLELGGQKALESAQTLLSIGLNPSISPSSDKNEEKRNIIERPFLSEAHAAVSV